MHVKQIRFQVAAQKIDCSFRLVYLTQLGQGGAVCDYLQLVGSVNYEGQGGENSNAAESYWMSLPNTVRELVNALKSHLDFDDDHPNNEPAAILRMPSGSNLNCPFFGGVKRACQNSINLSQHICKGPGKSSGQGVQFGELLAAFWTANPPIPHLPDHPVIVVVDDVFSTGKSMAAVMRMFAPHVPENAVYVLACPLHVNAPGAALAALGIQLDIIP
jgi:hypothetical protein